MHALSLFPSLPIPLHVGAPEPGGPLYTHWRIEPGVALFIFGLTALYLAWVGPLNRRRPGSEDRPVSRGERTAFLGGSLAALLALGPPVDDWSHFFFASAHMAQHLLLMLVAVPLWLLGIPAWVYRPAVRHPLLGPAGRWLTRPLPAFVIGTAINVVWHLPVLYDAALRVEALHVLQHLCFLAAGVFLWWPLLSKVPEWPALSPPLQCLYLFLQTVPGGIIGAFITNAGAGLYAHYEEASVRPWGLGLKVDQEIAGLTMWVGTNTLFLVLITIIFLRWAGQEESRDRQRLPSGTKPGATRPATSANPPGA
ncbi:MAG: cytochrome c oxidase assembly protein [Chloroflexota bacterium]|nr:cytochrome c oxidase assembly protein [Chloroflexota bacterium]